MLIKCQTQFDITATDVKNNFNKNRMPFCDASGCMITTEAAWHHARNQQRNWETVTQILSLRTLPVSITRPTVVDIQGIKHWEFDFELERDDPEQITLLEADCADVPMLTGLTESPGVENALAVGRNIIFKQV